MPIAYFSRKWRSPTERAADPCRRELSALKQAVDKWHVLLFAEPFYVVTDNMGVFHMVSNLAKGKLPKSPILIRYLNTISAYCVRGIEHKPTTQVFTSDALSRSAWMDTAIESDDPSSLPDLSYL